LVGIDVGGTKMLAVAFDRSQPTEILARHLVSTPSTAEGVISSLIELAQRCPHWQ
jgi:predicted NBD/HSP70 family sugar kinase